MIDYLNPHHVYPDAQNQPDLNLHLPREVSNLEIKEARIENARIGTIGYVGAGKVGPNIYDLHFIDTLNQAMNEAVKKFGISVEEIETGWNYFTDCLCSTQNEWFYFDDYKKIRKAKHLSLHSKKFRTRKKWANWLQRRYEL